MIFINPKIDFAFKKIFGFVMFSELDNVTSRFILKEKDYLIDYPIYDIELVFVELPKFKKELTELITIVDKWLYFLTHARSLVDIPEAMESIPEIKKAFYVANQANMTLEELEDQEKREIFIQDQRGAIAKALRLGLEQGLEQGPELGLEQGLERGLERGSQQRAIEIAKKMLNLMDDRAICELTGLAIADLELLRQSL
jgi:predicted transposase/invertase (TIGR01784 family)